MGSLFTKPVKRAPITSKDKAILDLKITRDKLTKYQKQVDPHLFFGIMKENLIYMCVDGCGIRETEEPGSRTFTSRK